LLQGDLLSPLPEPVDIIAANLPYITSRDYPNLMADVRDYEPRLALEAGPEGLDLIERLLDQAPGHLYPGGVIFLEIGADQGQAVLKLVERLLPQARHIGLRQDYHGYDRLVVIGL
jgi:release factor glutamine methyltransferase